MKNKIGLQKKREWNNRKKGIDTTEDERHS